MVAEPLLGLDILEELDLGDAVVLEVEQQVGDQVRGPFELEVLPGGRQSLQVPLNIHLELPL